MRNGQAPEGSTRRRAGRKAALGLWAAAAASSAQAHGGGEVVGAALYALATMLALGGWGALCVRCIQRPWRAGAHPPTAPRWLRIARAAAPFWATTVALSVAAMALGSFAPRPTLGLSGLVLQVMLFVTAGLAVAVVVDGSLRGPAGAWPGAQQGVAWAWLLLCPAALVWDRGTWHHDRSAPDVRALTLAQLRPLRVDETGDRLMALQPAPGTCQLRLMRQGGTPGSDADNTLMLQTYGPADPTTAPADVTDTVPVAEWQRHQATVLALQPDQLALQFDTAGVGPLDAGSVRRSGLAWQVAAGDYFDADYWTARAALRLFRRQTTASVEPPAPAPGSEAEKGARLLALAPFAPLKLGSSDFAWRVNTTLQTLTLAGLSCELAPDSVQRSCLDNASAQRCMVTSLERICELGQQPQIDGRIIKLGLGDPTVALQTGLALFMWRSSAPVHDSVGTACDLVSGQVLDPGSRIAHGPATLMCPHQSQAPHAPDEHDAWVRAELPFDAAWRLQTAPWLAAHAQTLATGQARAEAAQRAAQRLAELEAAARPKVSATLWLRTTRETSCNGPGAAWCRRFNAELGPGHDAVTLEERCADSRSQHLVSRFNAPLWLMR